MFYSIWVQVNFSNLLKDQPDHVIILMNKDNKQIFEPYKINIVTGDMEKLFENKDASSPISGYEFDKDGVYITKYLPSLKMAS